MQELLRKHFWAVTVVTVLLCTFFVAKIAANILETSVLADPKVSPKLTVAYKANDKPDTKRSKDGSDLIARNMFCSECSPPSGETAVGPGGNTSLPLVLVNTNVSGRDEWSYATIINTATQRQGVFSVGDDIPGAGPLKAVHYKYVEFQNGGRVERLAFGGESAPMAAPVVAAVPAPATGEPVDDLTASLDAGVKKIDETNYEISRSLLDQVLANPYALQKAGKVSPAVTKGKPTGLRLYSVKPNSVYGKIGLQSGDVINGINGFDLTSMEQGLEAYSKLKQASNLELTITRRGAQQTMKYVVK